MLLKACIILVNVSIMKTQITLPPLVSICTGDVCYIRPEPTSRGNWTEAQQMCQRFISTTLPIVDNLEHQKSFEAAARRFTTKEELKLGIWIGAKASYSKPLNWTWLDGSNYAETVMQSGEGFGFYAFVQDTSPGIRAYATDPKERHSYICFYPTAGEDKHADNIMCKRDAGRTVLNIEPRCYVKYDEQFSWFHARNNCLANGGDLASFTNFSILEGQIGSNRFWVGLRSSQWNWQNAVTGVPSDVTFTLWSSDQPKNDTTPTCISTDEGDKFPNWRDYNCNESLPFICQFPSPFALISTPEIYSTPSSTPRHTAQASLRSSTIGTNISTTPSVSSTTPSVSSNEDRQMKDTGSVNTIALAVGLGVGIGVPVILAIVVVVIVIAVRRKRRNSNAGGNSKSEETAASNDSQITEENNRMEMNETQNGRPHYDNFPAQYATIPAAAAGPKLDAPSKQGTVYADLSFDQAGPS